MKRAKHWTKRIVRPPNGLLNPTTAALASPLLIPPPPRPTPSPFRLPPPPFSTATPRLGPYLDTLPPFAKAGGALTLRRKPAYDLLHELATFRRACALGHIELSQPHTRERRRKIIKIVAYTMRMLLKLGRFRAADELDRAFFSTKSAELESPRASTSKEPYSESKWEEYTLGDGLGLSRSGICQAWMQSLALRLEPEVYHTLDEFGSLLVDMRALKDVALDPRIVSFLVRKASGISERIRSQGEEGGEAVLRELLFVLEPTRRKAKSSLLKRALVESELLRQEAAAEVISFKSTRFRKLEMAIEELLHDADNQSLESVTGYENKDQLHGRAHTLHLGIRLLLLRAKIAINDETNPLDRSTLASHSIESSLILYDSLLSLLPIVTTSSSSRDELELLRERQSSALYRILWACQGTFDLVLPREAPINPYDRLSGDEMLTREAEESTPPANLELLSHALSALSSTLAAVSPLSSLSPPHLPRQHPALIDVSVLYWRRLIYALTLPSCPSRRAPPRPPAERPPWATLKACLMLLQSCRNYDRSLSPSPSAPGAPLLKPGTDLETPSHTRALFIRRSLIIHLVRAVLLGGMNPRSEGEESPEKRLTFLLEFLDDFNERKARRTVVREAVVIILEREFQGPVWQQRREKMRLVVGEWCDKEERKNPPESELAADSALISPPEEEKTILTPLEQLPTFLAPSTPLPFEPVPSIIPSYQSSSPSPTPTPFSESLVTFTKVT